MSHETNLTRLETAFRLAEDGLGITRLIDPEDVDVDNPDERSIMTYVAQFLHKYPEGSKVIESLCTTWETWIFKEESITVSDPIALLIIFPLSFSESMF